MILANTSIWEDSIINNCDIAILGGGFLGLWSAYFLKQKNPKLNIHIYERDSIGLGASTRNAGFSCFGTVGEFVADTLISSEEEAFKSIQERYLGLQEIQKFIKSYNIDIDYENIGGYELLESEKFESVVDKIPYLNALMKEHLNLDNTYQYSHIKNTKLHFNSNKFNHIISNPYEAGVNSAKLLMGLKHINESLGVKIFQGTEVKAIEDNTIFLSNNYREYQVKTKKIVLALNSFVNKFINHTITPCRGQIIWCDNLKLNFKGTYHFDDGYYYFRTIGDDQLLIGGARNSDFETEYTQEYSKNSKIQEKLLSFVHQELKVSDFIIKKQWQGIMGFSHNKQSIIKEVNPNIWHLHACNGMGVALTPLIAKQFSDMI
jgi:glycine/D-amino acid oxidase-like deaminating enzyme